MRPITNLKPILLFLALLLLCLVAIHPFLIDTMPLTDDGAIHLYRSIVLDYSIRHDEIIYPRYSPALVYGYGAPLFNYFPPTGYYPSVLIHAIGFSWLSAWKGTMIFYVLIAARGAYLLGREWTDEIGGFITAAAYVYSPYALFDTVTRGTSTEFAGMAFLPLALWAFTRLARYGQRRDFILAVLSYALFIILHNVMTLYGSLLLVAYSAFLVLMSSNKKTAFAQMFAAGLLAVLMTTFFWWPALAETDFVKINGVAENLDFLDVRNTLRSLADVFALPRTADPTQLQAPIPVTFAWPQIILALIGLTIAFRKRTQTIIPLQIILLVTISIVTFSQLEISATVWQSIPILRYSQFAWRTMSIASLALALLAGLGASLVLNIIRQKAAKIVLFCTSLFIIIIYAIPWLYRPMIDIQAESVADAIQHEIDTGELALSSYSEYLPVLTDESVLNPTRLLSHFQDNMTPPRLQENGAVTVLNAKYAGTSAILSLAVSEATTLVFDWLYFEGWQASIDNQPVEVYPSGEAAFVAVDIEAGTHNLAIELKDTLTQQNAVCLSWIALAAFFLLAVVYPFEKQPVGTPNGVSALQTTSAKTSLYITTAILSLALFLTKTSIIDRTNNPLRTERFTNSIENAVDIPLNTSLNNEIRLLGASSINNVKSGETAEIHLFWTLVDEPISTNYSSLIELRDSQGIIIAETGSFYIGGLATTEWLSGYYLEELIQLEIPPATSPDTYFVDASLIQSQTGELLNILNPDGNPIDVKVSLGTLRVIQPDTPIQIDSEPIASTDNLALLKINGLPEQAQVGDEMIIDWLVEMTALTDEAIQAKLRWLDADHQTIAETQSVDLVTNFQTNQWQVEDTWRGYHRFYIPGNLGAGEYTLAIQFGDTLAPLKAMQVTVPERNYEVPDVANTANAQWQNGINLLGYEQTESRITLVWQSESVLNENLRLFVQVLDSENRVLAVDDSIPLNWTRPTTSWDIGEVIMTEHNFANFSRDNTYLLIGWYDPFTGHRVLLQSGEDSLTISS